MTELSEPDWVLLADMGGTHARFAYLKPDHPVPQLIGAYTADTCPTFCLLYTSPSPRDLSTSRMPSSA